MIHLQICFVLYPRHPSPTPFPPTPPPAYSKIEQLLFTLFWMNSPSPTVCVWDSAAEALNFFWQIGAFSKLCHNSVVCVRACVQLLNFLLGLSAPPVWKPPSLPCPHPLMAEILNDSVFISYECEAKQSRPMHISLHHILLALWALCCCCRRLLLTSIIWPRWAGFPGPN